MATVTIPPGNLNPGALIANQDLVNIVEGEQEFVTAGNLNLSGFADGLNRFVIGARSRVKNSAAVPWRFDCDYGTNPYVLIAGGGPHYLWPDGGSDLFTRLKMISPGRLFLVGGGTVTHTEQRSGILDINAAVVATNLRLFGGQCVQGYNATANTAWLVGPGANLTTERGFSGTSIVYGGRVSAKISDSSGTLPTGGTLQVFGGEVEWMMGDISRVELYGPDAVLDLSKAPKDMTITTLIMDSWAKRNPRNKFVSQHAAVTLPSVGTYLASSALTVLADEYDSLIG
jgi:hypothetical protein